MGPPAAAVNGQPVVVRAAAVGMMTQIWKQREGQRLQQGGAPRKSVLLVLAAGQPKYPGSVLQQRQQQVRLVSLTLLLLLRVGR